MQRFRFEHEVLTSDDERLEGALSVAHAGRFRPLCLCLAEGVPMYVAHSGGHHLIKRMPGSGCHHHPHCPSYDPPAEFSGLGEVAGSAIQEDVETGMTTLKLDFSLAKVARNGQPSGAGAAADSVRTDGAKLTLRGTLHYLWEQAELNRWAPGMANRRTWFVVRARLLAASVGKLAKGTALEPLLFVPEQFSLEQRDEIYRRRMVRLAPIATSTHGKRQLMVVIGEVKAIEHARYGFKFTLKHLPDLQLLVSEVLHRRLLKRFESEIALWEAEESTRLVMIGTFGFDAAGNAVVEEASLMVTTANWIPVETRWDLAVIEALESAGRRFTRGLRYNMGDNRPLATAVLSDSAPSAVAMYVIPVNAEAEFNDSLDQLIASGALEPWVWRPADCSMPPLPPLRQGRQSSPVESNVP